MASCEHASAERFRVCPHILDDEDLDHVVRFTGHGIECEYMCRACAEGGAPDLVDVCPACRERATTSWQGIVGTPQIAEEPSTIRIVHRRVDFAWPALTDLQPVLGADRNRWIGVSADATLHEIDLDARTTRVIANAGLEVPRPMLRLSRDARLAAVVDRTGVRGVIFDLEERHALLPLVRESEGHGVFPVAFFERDGRTLAVHSPAWNRLDIVDPRTGEVLTRRDSPAHDGAHYLDYFHCGLHVSRDQRWIADTGWVWHPIGVVTAWSLDRWLANPWESEDGASLRSLCSHEDWDGPTCWLDGGALAVYGYGHDVASQIPGVRIFDAATGAELRWFPGPRGELDFDRELLAIDDEHGLSVWNVARGTRLFADGALTKARYHPGAKTFVSIADGTTSVLRGADARWNRGAVTALAARIADERAFEDLPVLGDALEAEGCDDAALLAHCHAREPHGDRCWVLDRISAAADR